MRVDVEQFESLYQRDSDPWDFASSPYEQRKYDVTIASLPRSFYRRCFEPGCSIGSLTRRLTQRVEEVVAIDVSSTAVAIAAQQLAAFSNVSVTVGSLPEHWPQGTFDLIVWSELGYYWDAPELANMVERAQSLQSSRGHFLAVHWLGNSDDHLLGGGKVHEVLHDVLGVPVVHHLERQFILDVWEKK
jgi:SAM-dependent methyltransferase